MIIVLSAIAFVGALAQLAVAPLLGAIAEDLDVSAAAVGQAVTITFLAGATLGLIAGPMGDHFGHRRMLLAGGVFSALSLLASALAPTYTTFLLARIPAGLGGAMLAASAVVIASTRLPQEDRRAAIGWIMTAYAMVPIIGFPIMAQIAHVVNWRGSMLLLGVLALIALLIAMTMVEHDGPWPRQRFALRDTLQAYIPILHDNAALALQLSNFLRTVAAFSVVTYLSAYLMTSQGYSIAVVGYVYLTAGFGYFIGSRLGDGRYLPISLRNLQSLTAVVFGVAFAIPLIFTLGATGTAILMMLGSIAMSAGFVALLILISEESPGGAATALMLRQSGFAGGNAAAGALGGAILATSGFATFGIVTLILALLAAVIGQWAPGHKTVPATG
jgi:predicted MFS family arabinose efflux permease